MNRAGWVVTIAMLVAVGGCSSGGAARRRDAGARRPHDPGHERTVRDAGVDANRVVIERATVIEPAAAPDEESVGTEPVGARRIVYEVVLQTAGRPRPGASTAAAVAPVAKTAELRVDVSANRIRARWSGMGAPVEAGSEVRLRAGVDGAYLYDGSGGRAVEGGELAAWLDGRASGSARARVTVELDPPPPRGQRPDAGVGGGSGADAGPPEMRPDPLPSTTRPSGSLVCALLAELAGVPRASLTRRCSRGAPRAFTLGAWRGTRVADLDVDLPAESLRADEAAPPVRIVRSRTRALFSPAELSQVMPLPEPASPSPAPSPSGPTRAGAGDAPPVPGEGLLIVNESSSRAIVLVAGLPIAWVDSGESATIVGLRAGRYSVGAISPLGTSSVRARVLTLPTRWVIP